MTEAVLFVCCRADDPARRYVPGSSERPCDECGATIAVSPATLARSEATHEGSLFMCVACGAPKLGGLTLHPPSGAQVAELEAAGHDPQAWPLREHWGEKLRSKP